MAMSYKEIQSMTKQEKLNYVEFPASDIYATKKFFEDAFGWTFEDYSPEYTSFTGQGLDGGFYKSDLISRAADGSALLVLLSHNINITQSNVESAGGKISLPIFSFPGGQRFHFIEPSGNELAVWSKLST
jgi:predicted enzyme related to lactoylglutathione lyase